MLTRRLALACTLVLGGPLACSAGNDSANPRAPATKTSEPDPPGSIDWTAESGPIVVSFSTKRPLPKRKVIIGSQTTTTDEAGRFAVPDTGVPYDAIVIEPDGSSVSIYKALTRMDPVLLHKPSVIDVPAESAHVKGRLTGGTSFPLSSASDVATVYFLSSSVSDRVVFGGGMAPFGPDYLLFLPWTGPRSLSGELVAVGTFATSAAGGSYSAAFARRSFTLNSGGNVTQDLTLTRLPTGRLSGKVSWAGEGSLTQATAYFRLPFPDSTITFPGADIALQNPLHTGGAFEYQLPDVRIAGAQLCVAAAASKAKASLNGERCGLELGGGPVSMTLHAAPLLSSPAEGATIASGSEISWATVPNAVYLIELAAGEASPYAPRIDVFTAGTSFTLPDTKLWGIELPRAASYQLTIAGLEPYASMDEAASREGLGALVPQERQINSAEPVGVTTP